MSARTGAATGGTHLGAINVVGGTFVLATVGAEAVMQETWGHLAPEPGRAYAGTILLTVAAYGGDVVVVDADFPDLPDNPWLCEHMQDLAYEEGREHAGVVRRWTGTYRMFKNGRHRFTGKSETIAALRSAS